MSSSRWGEGQLEEGLAKTLEEETQGGGGGGGNSHTPGNAFR